MPIGRSSFSEYRRIPAVGYIHGYTLTFCHDGFSPEWFLSHSSSSGMSATMKLPRCSCLGGGGGVSLFWVFRPSLCRLTSVRYLVRVWAFTSIPFSCSFSTISWVSKPRFFIRSSVGARVKIACFTVMARFPSSVTVAGLSLANSCRTSFSWLVVMLMVVSPMGGGACPRFCLLLWRSSGTLAHGFTQ